MNYKRILIVRTDRIGDVVLSTPVISNLRKSLPSSFIAMMVTPYTQDIVKNNPFLNEVIVYDKKGKYRSWLSSFRFALFLRKKRFDLAIILHPTNRAHLVTFFAGIPKRIGFNRKMGFLLTDKVKDLKHEGKKHESEYCLDFLRILDIATDLKDTYVGWDKNAQEEVDCLLSGKGIKKDDKFILIHPGASCSSRRWPVDKFSKLCDRLVEIYKMKVVLVASREQKNISAEVINKMYSSAVDLSGSCNIAQLICLIKRAGLFVSNDSGPVHIAASLGVPVVAIFSRNQSGLSPKRWYPLGEKSRFIKKDAGCLVCLAHDCKKGFKCLSLIKVSDILTIIDELINL
ncbi:MAG: lipopolysaccharide heptosyltransferase II [Candidatus Gygaella obscura]|nr:lipopolysaccharide heptosyltransferase II [Candidatus Gygaella obscura]